MATTPLVVGLSVWIGKVWANRILESDRAKYQTKMETLIADMRTRDEKELFVHKLQFEKEFEIYGELWEQALELARASDSFRSIRTSSTPSSQDIRPKLKKLYNQLNDTIFNNRPFYEPTVFSLSATLIENMSEIVSAHDLLAHYQKNAEENGPELLALLMEREDLLDSIRCEIIPSLCDAIRNRIWSTPGKSWNRPDDSASEESAQGDLDE